MLSTVEGESAICLDVETTLEFITGGGAYLPGLDDNFLSDRVVTFPMVRGFAMPLESSFANVSSLGPHCPL